MAEAIEAIASLPPRRRTAVHRAAALGPATSGLIASYERLGYGRTNIGCKVLVVAHTNFHRRQSRPQIARDRQEIAKIAKISREEIARRSQEIARDRDEAQKSPKIAICDTPTLQAKCDLTVDLAAPG